MSCANCVAEWQRHREELAALPIGLERPTLLGRDCEEPSCALADARLDRMDALGGVGAGLALRLRSIRDTMATRPAQARAREWQSQHELFEEACARPAEMPITSESWDHSIPAAARVADFDLERGAWVRLEQAFVAARSEHLAVVVLAGPSKIGKTCAAARWAGGKPGARFVTAACVAGLSEAVGSLDRRELDLLRAAPALVIDDLLRAADDRSVEREMARVTELVRTRESRSLPTVITTLNARALPPSLVKRARITTVY